MSPQNQPNKLRDDDATIDLKTALERLGNYHLLRKLGEGGMGIVYEARPLTGGGTVALKTLRSVTPESLARLKSEFRVLSDLAHRNLVKFFDLDTTERIPFFTMEVLVGKPFSEYVSAGFDSRSAAPFRAFNEERLRHSLRELAEGLSALHHAGLVHRDIKPSNVMVTDEGRVVLLDMGLVAEVVVDTPIYSPFGIAGTPYYMAPEQARGDEITPAYDWYAVGVMLYEALTGERLFKGNDLHALTQQKLGTDRPSPRDVQPDIPEDLSQLSMKLLHPSPADRPTGDEILHLLRGAPVDPGDQWIGREVELQRLRQAWDDVKGGATQVVLISGQSGIGKTALVDHFLASCRQRDRIVVFRGRCYENEAVAYRGFDGVVDVLKEYLLQLPRDEIERVLPLNMDHLCQLFPVLEDVVSRLGQRMQAASRQGDPRERKLKGIVALRELFCRLSRYAAIVIFIDDLHLGDEDTAAIYEVLMERDESPNLLVLATYRQENANTKCLIRIRESQFKTVPQVELLVERLSIEESIRLGAALLQGADIEDCNDSQRIADESKGDPLFIRMLVENLIRSHRCEFPTGGKKSTWTLESVMDDRVASLDQHEQVALEILAAAGRPIDERVLETIVETENHFIGLVRSLRVKRLVHRLGDAESIEPIHDKLREAMLRRLSSTRLAQHCLTLAHRLDRSSSDRNDEQLADLYRRGGESARAGECYVAAAQTAHSVFAFQRAVEYLEYAISLLNPSGERERTLQIGLADALANASRSAESAAHYLVAASLSNEFERPRLQQLAALRLLTSGHVADGTGTLKLVLAHYRLPWPQNRLSAMLGLLARMARLRICSLSIRRTGHPTAPSPAKSSIDDAKIEACWSAAAGFSLVDPLRGAFYTTETLLRSLRSRSQATLPRDLAAYVGQVAIGGSQSRSATRRVLVASRSLVRSRREPYARGTLCLSRGIAALLRGEWSAALSGCDNAVRHYFDGNCHGTTWELATARTFALWALQYQGNLPELARRQPDLMRAAKEAGDLFATLNFGTQVTAHLELAADNPDESHRRLNEDQTRLSDQGFFIQHHNFVLARTYTFLYQGRVADAANAIDGQWKNYRREFLSRIQQVRIDHHQVGIRVLIALAAEKIDRSKNLLAARSEIRRLRRERVPWATAMAMAFDAAADQVAGDPEQAISKLKSSIELLRKVDMNLFAIAAQHHVDSRTGTEGERLATQWSERGVINGSRMARTLIPGFQSPE